MSRSTRPRRAFVVPALGAAVLAALALVRQPPQARPPEPPQQYTPQQANPLGPFTPAHPGPQQGQITAVPGSVDRPDTVQTMASSIPAPPPNAPGAQPAFAAYQTRAEYSPTDEEAQPTVLPTLPVGMTVDMIRGGDDLYHGRAGCFACHGPEGTGGVRAGAALTAGLLFVDPHQWSQIDSLIAAGVPDGVTRSPIAMPARGARGDLTREETACVAAYVWAIANVRGEPWPGGHRWHTQYGPPAVPRTNGP